MAGPWMYEKKYNVECVSIPASMWKSKATILPYLDHLKKKGLAENTLASRADVLLFQFVDEAGNVILPNDEETKERMRTCIPDIYDYENYSYDNFDGLLVRKSTEKVKLAQPLTALQFYENCNAMREPPPDTREGILQLFDDLAADGAIIPYKTDAYCHYKDGSILDIDDIVSPLDFVDSMFGINTNMYLISPPGTLSSFHVEELRLASINGIKMGDKVWWFVVDPEGIAGPAQMAARLEAAIRKALLGLGEQFAGCSAFMMAKRYAIHPNFLANENIQLITVNQSKGQFVYTGVNSYHMVLSKKCTISTAKNLIPVRTDGEFAFVPSIRNFCAGNHPPSFKEVHNSGLGRIVYNELSAGMGISGLVNTYMLAVKSRAFDNCRLPALTRYTGNLNAIEDEYERLMEAKRYLLCVWTNVTNSSNKPITGYVMHVSKEEEYAIIAPRFSPDSSLVIRSFTSIRLSPDKYASEVKKPFKLFPNIRLDQIDRESMNPFHQATIINYDNLASPIASSSTSSSVPDSVDNLSHEMEDSVIPVIPQSQLDDSSEHGGVVTRTMTNDDMEDPIEPASNQSTSDAIVDESRQESPDRDDKREPSTNLRQQPESSPSVPSAHGDSRLASDAVNQQDRARSGFQGVVDDIFSIRAAATRSRPIATAPNVPRPTSSVSVTSIAASSQVIPRSNVPQTVTWPTSMINPRGEYPDSQKVRVHGFPETCPYSCILNTLSQYGPLVGIIVSSFRGNNIVAVYQSALGASTAKAKSGRNEISHEGVPIIISPYFRCQPLQRQQQPRFGGGKRMRFDGGSSTIFNVFSGAHVHYSNQ